MHCTSHNDASFLWSFLGWRYIVCDTRAHWRPPNHVQRQQRTPYVCSIHFEAFSTYIETSERTIATTAKNLEILFHVTNASHYLFRIELMCVRLMGRREKREKILRPRSKWTFLPKRRTDSDRQLAMAAGDFNIYKIIFVRLAGVRSPSKQIDDSYIFLSFVFAVFFIANVYDWIAGPLCVCVRTPTNANCLERYHFWVDLIISCARAFPIGIHWPAGRRQWA